MIRIGLLSVAHLHAEGYVHNLRAISGVELVGIADGDLARGREFASQFEVRLFDRYESLLEQRLDGVIICSENTRHRSLVELAAQAGVAVLCEKPLATSRADADATIAACRSAEIALMVAFPMRFSAPLLEIKRILDESTLGRIFCCNATNQGQNPRHKRAWFVDRALAGGGALTDHTAHLVDIMRWFFSSEVTEVYAQVNEIMPSGGDVESGGLLSLRFEHGPFATIDCSWSRPASYPTWGGLTLELIGDRGIIAADAFRQTLTVYPEQTTHARWLYWGSDSNQAMVEEFVAAIREHRPPSITGQDALKAVEVVAAAYQSAQTGQPVRLQGQRVKGQGSKDKGIPP